MQADFNWNASKWETAGFVTFCCISNVRNAIFIIIIIYFFLHNFNSLLSSDKVLFFYWRSHLGKDLREAERVLVDNEWKRWETDIFHNNFPE